MPEKKENILGSHLERLAIEHINHTHRKHSRSKTSCLARLIIHEEALPVVVEALIMTAVMHDTLRIHEAIH